MSNRKRKYREYLRNSEKEVPGRSMRRYLNEGGIGMVEEDVQTTIIIPGE